VVIILKQLCGNPTSAIVVRIRVLRVGRGAAVREEMDICHRGAEAGSWVGGGGGWGAWGGGSSVDYSCSWEEVR